jgi:DNA-binding transcriptional MerR regulator
MDALKVGELAKRTGLTIRTLHHYDEIGLLKPSHRTDTGYRLYTAADVGRLMQIVSLRQLGFSLEEVKGCLDRPGFSPLEVIQMHASRLREQIELERQLCERLEAVAAWCRTTGEVSAEMFLQAIESMIMIEQYYTPEQMEQFRHRAAAPGGKEETEKGTADWAELIADYTAEMRAGTDPADPKAQALEQRRQALVNMFTRGDPAIEQNLKRLWIEQGDKMAAQFGYDPKVMEYLGKVADAAKK